jgi:hypothetical protein
MINGREIIVTVKKWDSWDKDFETDKESSESENLDLENIKFFSQSNYNPQISLASLAIKKNHSNILSKNFLAIPTSPPKSCTKTRIS